MTINKSKRILSELSRLGETELYVIFAMITEHGFLFEDLEGLTVSQFQYLQQLKVLTTMDGRKNAVLRTGVWKRLQTICQSYQAIGSPRHFPIFPLDKHQKKVNPYPMKRKGFDYKLGKIEKLTGLAFTYKQLVLFFRDQRIYQLMQDWAEHGDQSRFNNVEAMAMELAVQKSTVYNLIKGNIKAHALYKRIKSGQYISEIDKQIIDLQKEAYESNLSKEEIKQIQNDQEEIKRTIDNRSNRSN